MPNDDLTEAGQAERLGDDADSGQATVAYYRQAQRLLLPAGVVWTDRESYDLRMAAFERIQQKLYRLQGGRPGTLPAQSPMPTPAPTVSISDAGILAPAASELSVWDFAPGLTVRVGLTFTDYDGQEIRAGEILHLVERSYFPYDGGHTLRFAEKTIRLTNIVDEHVPIIANTRNAWFQPLTRDSVDTAHR